MDEQLVHKSFSLFSVLLFYTNSVIHVMKMYYGQLERNKQILNFLSPK